MLTASDLYGSAQSRALGLDKLSSDRISASSYTQTSTASLLLRGAEFHAYMHRPDVSEAFKILKLEEGK